MHAKRATPQIMARGTERRGEAVRPILQRALQQHRLRLPRRISPHLWAEIVGPFLAARAQPTVLSGRTLHILVEDHRWRDQLDAARKFLLAKLNKRLGADLVGELQFGLAHTGSASAVYLVPLGFLGFVLCIVRWKTRSLYPCMALHSINNSLALGINQLHWNAAEILALILGSLLVIGAGTVPLSRPVLIEQRPATHP